MDRLTRGNLSNRNYCLYANVYPKRKDMEPEFKKAINKLGRYEDTGLTPEEVKYLRDASSNVLKFVMDKMKIKNECEQWRKEALTYAAQLGEIRIWLNQFGCTPEKLIADCKSKSPDTIETVSDKS